MKGGAFREFDEGVVFTVSSLFNGRFGGLEFAFVHFAGFFSFI
jgi:hypothetical protein